jgi:hypothetical protein
MLFLSCILSWYTGFSQFTEPVEIPNGSTLTDYANVIAAKAQGENGNYTFSVTLESPDTDCEQYADWWEVIDSNGNLLYRRILLHPHVNEQPFTRSGGPVAIGDEQEVWIRAHMNNSGYGGQVLKGSVKRGFKRANIPLQFALELVNKEPLPQGCDQ